jgi:tetratricopeptide (TPR) repeat protein
VFRLASGARVAEALRRMEVPPGAPLDPEVALELAIREGLKGVVAGEIHRVGSGYTVSARLLAAETGAELFAAIETAREPDDLVQAVERLSLRMRERVGESLRSVRRSPPLERVRTASLAALKSYTEGADANARGEFERCALLMEEALALDSTFAMAYEGRAACNQNLGRNPAGQIADRVRAYGMRDRMTDEERLRFTATYHQYVTRERRPAIDAWEAYAARYPDRPSAVFALANLYAQGRDWERAEATLRRGLELSPSSRVVLINLAGYQAFMGRFDDAVASLAQLEEAAPGIDLAWRRATLRLSAGDWEGGRSDLAIARERARGSASQRALVATLQARLARTVGRLEEAEQHLREAMASDLAEGDIERYHLVVFELADLFLTARGDTAAALALLDQALASYPFRSLEPLDRHYIPLAQLYAAAGRPDLARSTIDRHEREVAPLRPVPPVPPRVRAALAEAAGQFPEAMAEWRLEDEENEDPLPALAHLGSLFDRLGQADSAISYYRRYLSTPSRLRYDADPRWRGHVLERLGHLHDARGDREEAARHYAMLAELWSGADPPLQERARFALGRVRVLAGER